ncbi:YdhR family protein [Pelosinus baikalensis]|uniref:YdhR family protein n=1 Tax=Pelosinus baikalensis TaxID=2892015 RepID=A0ABS8HXV7_9FIRM|nr:YdhR family protein [Pelosinus baikalensis]MCC5467339.1 YdhR family protein [Pelosinus baikalensis]
MVFNPFWSFIRTLGYLFTSTIRFPNNRKGDIFRSDDGVQFEIFRQVVIKPTKNQPKYPGALFRVRFRLAGMSPQKNIKFSILPIPFIIGLSGFRSKLWMVNKTSGEFQGVYEWDTKEHAELYARSFAMNFMRKRSVPGSVTYTILELN